MKRPVVFILLFLIYGITGGQHLWGAIGVVLFMLGGLIFAVIVRKVYALESAVLLIISALIGFILGFGSISYTNSEIDALADSSAKPYMSCVVTDITGKYDYYSQYTVRLKYMKYKDKTYTDNIKIRLVTSAELEPGDIISIKAPLKHGESDYNEDYRMLSRHIEYKTFGSAFVTGYDKSFNTCMYRARKKIADVYDTVLPYKESGLLRAIILGDRLDVDDYVYSLFRSAGIVHIIAISGLHISIFASILMLVLGKINKNLARVSVLALLLLYAIFTGGSPSVVRAVIMMYILTIGNILGRDYDLISSCALACIILLVYSPCYLYDAGFQYSFTAVFCIGLTLDILDKLSINGSLISAFIVSLAVCYGVKPITLYYFGYVNFVDFIVNIIVVSFMGILVFFGGIAGIAGLFSVKAGIFVSGLPYVLLRITEYLCALSLKLPFSDVSGSIKGSTVIMLYILAILIYLHIMRKDIKQRGDILERAG